MKRKISCIYSSTNKINRKIYVGSTNDYVRRLNEHSNDLRHNRHGNKHLQRAWNKYKSENFEFNILERVEPTKEKLKEREQYWMDYYQSYDLEKGYNIEKVAGGSPLGLKRSEETKRKIRIANLNKKFSLKTRRKMALAKLGKSWRDWKPRLTPYDKLIDPNVFKSLILKGLSSCQISTELKLSDAEGIRLYCKRHIPRLFRRLKENGKKQQGKRRDLFVYTRGRRKRKMKELEKESLNGHE